MAGTDPQTQQREVVCTHRRLGQRKPCARCVKAETQLRTEAHQAWFRRTGHCGACGQPGVFCLCQTDCGCAELHECGSGLSADAVETFTDVPISDDQAELFGSADV